MTITLTFAWWHIPAFITFTGLFWALCFVKGRGFLGGLDNVFALGVASIFSAIAWAIAGFCK